MSDDNQDIDDTVDDDAFDALVAELPDLLHDPSVWAEPPPWLGETIVAAIAAERDERGQQAPPMPPAPARRARRRPRQTWWLAAAAAIVAIAAVGVVATRLGGDEGGQALIAEGTELAPGASAELSVDELPAGVEITMDIHDLAPAPPGQYYQAWVRSEDGELVTIGTFHMRGGDATVTLWSGVELAQYPIVTVTIQTEGAGQDSSGEVVLRGSLIPSE